MITHTIKLNRRFSMKSIGYIVIILGFLLVTFWGMGPVLLADGSSQERLITLFVVLSLYLVLIILFLALRKRNKKNRKS